MQNKNLAMMCALALAFFVTPGISSAMSDTGEKAEAHDTKIKGFTDEERTIIRTVFDEVLDRTVGEDRDYEGHHHVKGKNKGKGLPPGLAKRDTLPPGLEKQIRETGHLPPGLEGRALPDKLRHRLPRRHDGTEIFWVDDDLYLVEAATRKVIDIIWDASKGK